MTVRFGLVGYGVGGRLFHAPYLQAAENIELTGVVVRNPERAAQARADLPGVTVFDSLTAMLEAGAVDAVTITTPPQTRRELVLEALAGGVDVVADKPFAPSAEVGRELTAAAEAAGRVLNVFHNRRFDTDIVTARGIIASGRLGELRRLDLRCDQDAPATVEAGPTGGLLRDLGSHVVDQALALLGPAAAVSAQLDLAELDGGVTDVSYVVTILHTSGAHSHVSSTKMGRVSSRELRLFGANGSYTSDYSDVQFEATLAGRAPRDDASWGVESEERWGRLALLDGTDEIVPSGRGDYTDYYEAFAEAVVNRTAGPVPAAEGVGTLAVLDAARVSAETGTTVAV